MKYSFKAWIVRSTKFDIAHGISHANMAKVKRVVSRRKIYYITDKLFWYLLKRSANNKKISAKYKSTAAEKLDWNVETILGFKLLAANLWLLLFGFLILSCLSCHFEWLSLLSSSSHLCPNEHQDCLKGHILHLAQESTLVENWDFRLLWRIGVLQGNAHPAAPSIDHQ